MKCHITLSTFQNATMSRGEIATVVYQKMFHEAVKNGDLTEVLRILEEKHMNFNINCFDKEGQTALHWCCTAGDVNSVKMLVKFGADHKLRTKDGFSCLDIACYSGHRNVVAYLLNKLRERQFYIDVGA